MMDNELINGLRDMAETCHANDEMQWSGVLLAANKRIKELEEQVERLLMDRGRKDAAIAVYLSALAVEARKGRSGWAREIIKRADAKAIAVKRKDLTVAHVNAPLGEKA
jgi:hypothetical protein